MLDTLLLQKKWIVVSEASFKLKILNFLSSLKSNVNLNILMKYLIEQTVLQKKRIVGSEASFS